MQVISSEGFYGAESMLLTLAGSLSRLGCPTSVTVFRDLRNPHTELATAASAQGLTVRIVDCKGRWDWNAVRSIEKLGLLQGVDVFHAHGYKADIFTYAAVRRRKEAALISTCHNWPSRKPLMRAYARADRLVLRGFHEITAPSRNVTDILRKSGIRSEKIAYIPNGVDVNRFREAGPRLRRELQAGNNRLIGFVGRHVEGKGGAILLRAARKVIGAQPQAMFVFVGEGPARREWIRLAADLGIGDKVVFLGTRQDMPGVYASLDVLVLPSFEEAMPMCMLEAMAANVPVIATRVGAVPEVLTSERTGCLVEAGSVAGLARELTRLLANPAQAAQLGREGGRRVNELFSADGMARKYMEVYRRALDKVFPSRHGSEMFA